MWSISKNDLQIAIDSFVPKCEIKRSKMTEPVWFNKTAKKAVKYQRKLYNISKKSGLPEDLEMYRTRRRSQKKNFFGRFLLKYTFYTIKQGC